VQENTVVLFLRGQRPAARPAARASVRAFAPTAFEQRLLNAVLDCVRGRR